MRRGATAPVTRLIFLQQASFPVQTVDQNRAVGYHRYCATTFVEQISPIRINNTSLLQNKEKVSAVGLIHSLRRDRTSPERTGR